MNLFKHFAAALMALALVGLVGVAPSMAYSVTARAVATPSIWCNGKITPQKSVLNPDGTRTTVVLGPQVSVVIDYEDSIGTMILKDSRGTFRGSFTNADVYFRVRYPGQMMENDSVTMQYGRRVQGTYRAVNGTRIAAQATFFIFDYDNGPPLKDAVGFFMQASNGFKWSSGDLASTNYNGLTGQYLDSGEMDVIIP